MSHSSSRNSPQGPILVPVDFEPTARAALVTGARLAMSTGSPLKVLHVVHAPADKPNYYERRTKGDVMLPIDEVAARMLKEFLLDVYRSNPELGNLETPDTLLVHGLPINRIAEVARLVDASQVVIGQRRTKGFLGNLLAPKAERIAKRCDVPVTIVYPDADGQPAEHRLPVASVSLDDRRVALRRSGRTASAGVPH